MTEQNNKCNARDQASDVVLLKYICVKNLRRHVIDNYSSDLQTSKRSKQCQLNRENLREIKDNSTL